MSKKITAFYIFLMILFVSGELFAQAIIPSTVYMIKEKESLESVASRLLPRFKIKYGKRIDDFKKDLVEWNPHITTWDEIPLHSNIFVDYPYPVYISHKWAPSLQAETNYNILNSDAETPMGNNQFTLFAMYTASAGEFKEKLNNQTGTIKSNQNSPFSFGIGTTIFLDKKNHMVSSSGYFSSLRTAKLIENGLNSNSLAPPHEFGFNLYYQHLTPWAGLSFYGGFDYEQFSTFNTTAYLDGQNLAFNKNKITYGTFGIGKTFFWGNQKILLKGSFAQSIESATSSVNPADKFDGQRVLLFASIKGESRFTYHLIFKRHTLEGPNQLTINRLGAGIGLVIF
jgi:hypothetical protein